MLLAVLDREQLADVCVVRHCRVACCAGCEAAEQESSLSELLRRGCFQWAHLLVGVTEQSFTHATATTMALYTVNP